MSISTTSGDAARESARESDGRFGTQALAEADDVALVDDWDPEALNRPDESGVAARAAAHRAGETGYYEPDDAEVESCTRDYITTLRWSSSVYEDADGPDETEAVQADDARFEMSDEAESECFEDVRDFLGSNKALIEEAATVVPGYGASQAMHDFALTRNGHGTGFWDRGLGDVGDRLTEAAKSHGGVDLCVDADGALHIF